MPEPIEDIAYHVLRLDPKFGLTDKFLAEPF